MRSTRRRFLVAVTLGLSLGAMVFVAKALDGKWPRSETSAIRAMRVIRVGMTYDEVKTALGEVGFRAGTFEANTIYIWGWIDSSIDVTFDANQRVSDAAIWKRPKPDAPFWDIPTHMGY